MTNTIKEQVQEQIKTAMRAQNKEQLNALRFILGEFKRIEVDERIVLDEARELAILDKMQKKLKEAISDFQKANRDDLVEKEQVILNIVQAFMPKGLEESEVQALIVSAIAESGAASIQDMAKVMAILKPKLQGRADIGVVSTKVKSLLAGS